MPGTIPQGKYCPHPVNAPDLVVTFFAQAGIELPWKMHGRDITPLLKDPDNAEWNHPVLYEHMGRDYGSDVTKALTSGMDSVHSGVPYYVALRHGSLKYIRYLGAAEPEELYDLASDPEELRNLATSGSHREMRERMHHMLLNELRGCDAEFVRLLDH
jgi:arylsulfatase A-like enzyme